MKRYPIILFMLLISISLVGCGKADLSGIILDVSDNTILLATDLSQEEYEEIKDIPARTLQKEDLHGERDSLGLIDIIYEKELDLQIGEQVDVWITGDILNSYPGQAKAKKIK